MGCFSSGFGVRESALAHQFEEEQAPHLFPGRSSAELANCQGVLRQLDGNPVLYHSPPPCLFFPVSHIAEGPMPGF